MNKIGILLVFVASSLGASTKDGEKIPKPQKSQNAPQSQAKEKGRMPSLEEGMNFKSNIKKFSDLPMRVGTGDSK